jgi:hypothetical protein
VVRMGEHRRRGSRMMRSSLWGGLEGARRRHNIMTMLKESSDTAIAHPLYKKLDNRFWGWRRGGVMTCLCSVEPPVVITTTRAYDFGHRTWFNHKKNTVLITRSLYHWCETIRVVSQFTWAVTSQKRSLIKHRNPRTLRCFIYSDENDTYCHSTIES